MDWLCCDAEKLTVPEETYTAYTISFGIRNCTHFDKVCDLIQLTNQHMNKPILLVSRSPCFQIVGAGGSVPRAGSGRSLHVSGV